MSSTHESPQVSRAKDILRGASATLDELKQLVEHLKEEKAFGYARKLLQRACLHPELAQDQKLRTRLIQQHALCTYKDPDLPLESKFDRALTILEQLGDLQTLEQSGSLSTEAKQETLGLAGAIHKYKWEAYGQKQYLEQALAFYLKGYQRGIASDFGYTAINAAYVLNLLGSLDQAEGQQTGLVSELAATRRQEAKHIREEIIATLPPLVEQPATAWLKNEWWFFATVAEAYFGLGRENSDLYKEARSWLQQGAHLPKAWERESTARQLATLARLQAGAAGGTGTIEGSPAWDVVRDFLGADYANGLRGIFLGKVGLALSGGGFRASLFHIGVLARLAEVDILRHVEVLSCVSGGSIIGAQYYLELRNLLHEKKDAEIGREDYIAIVQKIQKDFLVGVQRNIRMRVLADVWANMKMIVSPHSYSRTQRAGELYEEELFSRVDDGNGTKPRYMDDLLIKPLGEPENFAPKNDNWRRAAKVPMLILNATTLNTGHNWQFTATWMGEPPAEIDTEIDSNARLRRMYYDEAPHGYQKVRLGHAVAASACVPGIFDPLVFPQLYPDRTVRLVDGGVYDNQGVGSLLEQGCSIMLVSDASGQMTSQAEPRSGILGPPLRANAILQARVRAAEYHELDARRRASLLRGLLFVHLKKDLPSDSINWIDCEDPQDAIDEVLSAEPKGLLTSYGIRKDVQECLSAIRTDLDSFTDIEAYALMTSGYRMTAHEFCTSIEGFPAPAEAQRPWEFLAIESAMKRREGAAELRRCLGVSSELFLKAWRLLPHRLQLATAVLFGLPVVLVFFWTCWHWAGVPVFTVGLIGTIVALVMIGFLIGKVATRTVRYGETLIRIGCGLGMSLCGWLLARIHLRFIDPWYLRLGRLSGLKSLDQPAVQPPPVGAHDQSPVFLTPRGDGSPRDE